MPGWRPFPTWRARVSSGRQLLLPEVSGGPRRPLSGPPLTQVALPFAVQVSRVPGPVIPKSQKLPRTAQNSTEGLLRGPWGLEDFRLLLFSGEWGKVTTDSLVYLR